MSDLHTRIAAVLCAHPDLLSGKCHGIAEPEEQFDHQDQWAAHVADVLIRELGNLRQEPHRFQCGSDSCSRYRIISDWTTDD